MRSQSFIVRKSNTTTFYFRSIVPSDLIPILKTNQSQVSLKTGILRDAKRLARQLYVEAQNLYHRIRTESGMKTLDIESIKEILKKVVEQSRASIEGRLIESYKMSITEREYQINKEI